MKVGVAAQIDLRPIWCATLRTAFRVMRLNDCDQQPLNLQPDSNSGEMENGDTLQKSAVLQLRTLDCRARSRACPHDITAAMSSIPMFCCNVA